MASQPDPGPLSEDLDPIEVAMAFDEALPSISPEQRDRLIRAIQERIASPGDDGPDNDALTALVRKLGPRDPRGQAGAAAKPDDDAD